MKFASNFWVDPIPFFCHCRKPLYLPATPWHHDSEFCTGERHKKQRFKGFQEEQLGLFSALIIPTAYREASRAFVPFFRISAHKCLRQTHIHQVSHWCHSTTIYQGEILPMYSTHYNIYTLCHHDELCDCSQWENLLYFERHLQTGASREAGGFQSGGACLRPVLRDCQRLKRAFWLGCDWGVSLCLASSWVIRLKRSLVLTGDRSSCT